jgi:sulfoxide reductase heme-binding subunit YedZ
MAIAAGSIALGAVVYTLVEPSSTMFRWSMATAYVSMMLLAATLGLGPLNLLRGRPNPVSTDLRRDVGIWAAIVGLAHVVFGLQVHFPGRMREYFLRTDGEPGALPLRLDVFGLTNYAGLGAATVLVLLLALSNDRSLAALGTRRWKRLQRWNYAGWALIVLHGAAYQLLERRTLGLIVVFALLIGGTLAAQLAGFRAARREQRRPGAQE